MTTSILMVDDEPDAEVLFRQNFRKEIRKKELIFHFAQSGNDALDLICGDDAPQILLLLSDINMPGMSGMDLLSEVKSRKPDLPVIMITAYGDEKTEAEAKAKGADQLVAKPVDFNFLKATLNNYWVEN
ncbi:MAG: response regulator [Sneathiella sp.]